MYSGHLMDELMDMVARAEQHAQSTRVAPESKLDEMDYFAARYAYEATNQHALMGVA
jgi:hypothetical protein